MQVALGSKNESICVERGGAPKAPVFGGANPASVPGHVRNQVSQLLLFCLVRFDAVPPQKYTNLNGRGWPERQRCIGSEVGGVQLAGKGPEDENDKQS